MAEIQFALNVGCPSCFVRLDPVSEESDSWAAWRCPVCRNELTLSWGDFIHADAGLEPVLAGAETVVEIEIDDVQLHGPEQGALVEVG